MGQITEEKILRVYFENQGKGFTVRKLSNLTKIPRSTVQIKLNSLRKLKLIGRENVAETSLFFKIKKINYYIEKIVECELVDYLVEELNPSCIILFGSFRKGDSIKSSDIDIFVESCVKKEVNLTKFERRLGHRVDLFIKPKISNLHGNLFNNVINGIKLYGNIKLK